ncbi:DMT family transporter [Roseivivax isoporae]|uniref:Membrane protein n=1 Tax=Roseivivax isoporae LMG 25204 TaxID=1449351 RepID=X7FCX7_9RHOB|nr:DMT family transporter [Roseivivax isoporae]ETX29909.1 membrane protein [Roseivivax isoporae LMG 25204]
MEAWILFTLVAATLQTLRFALHKVLSLGGLSNGGSTFARFAFGFPFALLTLCAWLVWTGAAVPALGPGFWRFALAGALGQVLATLCMIALFRQRHFAVGIALMKTTVIQTALMGLVVLGEPLSAWGWAAIAVGVAGVVLLSDPPKDGGARAWAAGIGPRVLALGLAAGFLFAVAAIGVRGATLAVDSDDPFLRAAATLAVVTLVQTAGVGLWLRLSAPGELTRVWAARRTGALIGLSSMAGSVCWFTAYTLERAAYVQALGQVEVILSILAGAVFFGERITRREGAGIAVLTLSILTLVALA